MKSIIQTLDLSDLSHIQTKPSMINHVREILSTTGFFFLKNHGLDLHKIRRMEKSFETFFNLSHNQKMKYYYSETCGQKGYTPLNIETGEHFKIADEKEFFHVYPNDTPNVSEYQAFKYHVDTMWYQFNALANHIMESIAICINEDKDFFETKESGYSILRGIHYPTSENPLQDENDFTPGGNALGMCASKHTDINMITLLLAKEAGLQLFYENQWFPVTITDPNVLIVNVGDMLEHLTNGEFVSGLHRVVCQRNTPRYSYPFFFHVPSDFSIKPLERFGAPKEKYCFNTAGEFLDHRLKQINLKK